MSDTENPNENPDKEPLLLKLENEVDETTWDALQAHYDRGALVFISPELDFLTVAAKVIKDDVEEIKEWSDNKMIYNPSESGEEVDKSAKYRFIITQPYVLIQPIVEEPKEPLEIEIKE